MAEKRGKMKDRRWSGGAGKLKTRVLVLAWENEYPSHQNYNCQSTNVADSPHPFLLPEQSCHVQLKPSCYKTVVFLSADCRFFSPTKK